VAHAQPGRQAGAGGGCRERRGALERLAPLGRGLPREGQHQLGLAIVEAAICLVVARSSVALSLAVDVGDELVLDAGPRVELLVVERGAERVEDALAPGGEGGEPVYPVVPRIFVLALDDEAEGGGDLVLGERVVGEHGGGLSVSGGCSVAVLRQPGAAVLRRRATC
jgi:hypothetical protein